MDQGLTKICTKCKKLQDLKFFAKTDRTKDKLSFWCRSCHKTYRENNRDKILARKRIQSKEFRYKLRVEVLSHYCYGIPYCACCDEERIEFLCMDHIAGGGSKHKVEIGPGKLYIWLKKNNLPEGFRVLCHNCNQSLGAYGYCPHKTR